MVDAYTKRILSRHNIGGSDASYATLQKIFLDSFEEDTKLYNEYHALIVKLANEYCRPRVRCEGCPLEGV